MVDLRGWLGLGTNEDEDADAVSKTLNYLGSFGTAASDAVGTAASAIGDAASSAASALSDAYAVPAEERRPQYSGPSYAQPSPAPSPAPPVRDDWRGPEPIAPPPERGYWQPTEQEQAGMGPPVGPEWLPSPVRQAAGVVGSAAAAARGAEPISGPWIPGFAEQAAGSLAAGAGPVGAATDYLDARANPTAPMLVRSGILVTDLSPEQQERHNELQRRTSPASRRPGEAPLSPDELTEYRAIQDALEGRYREIKDDPEAFMGYYHAAPGSDVLPAFLGVAAAPAVGGALGSAARGGASALGAGARTASGIGYAADIAAQAAFDPTTPFVQGPIDAVTAAARRGGAGLVRRAVGGIADAIPAPPSGLRSAAYNAAQGGVLGAASESLEAGAEDREADPGEMARRALIGGALGVGAGMAARRGGAAGAAQALGSGFGGQGAMPPVATLPRGGATRAAASPNPHIRNMARQMQGNYTPSGVDRRPLTERIVAALTDRNAIAGNVEQEIAERIRVSGQLPPATRLAERVRYNPNSAATQRAREELGPGLRSVGEDADWMEQVLVHEHNLDVARGKGQEVYDEAIARGRTPQQAQAVADRVRQSRVFSGGMTESDITQALSDIAADLGPQRYQAVRDAAQAFWDTGRRSLDAKLAEGMISPALHRELTTRYPHYVRTDIADYFERGPAGPSPGGRTMGVSNVGIKAIDRVGTTKDRVNPVLSTIDALYAHEASLARNAAGRDLVALRDADPTARALFKEVAPDAGAYRGNRAEMVPPDYTLRGGEQKLTTWKHGEARQFVIPGEYSQLLTPKQGALLGDSGAAQGVRDFFGLWKSLITTHNPGFQMVASPIRDFGDYAVGQATRSGGPLDLPGVVADYVKALPSAFEGLGKNRFSSEVADLRRAGAGFEGRPARTDRDLRATYEDLRKSGGMAIRGPADAARAARTLLTLGAEPIGSRFELVPRIAAARRAAGRGADPLGQAIASKDATIDFLRGGWLTQQLNVPVPFLNPTVQSAAQVARLAKAHPTAFAASVATGIGVPAMLADAWNRSDPQRASDYEDVPDSVKNGGIVWMLPGVEGATALGERKPNYLWVPLGSFAFAARLAREGLALADPITGLESSGPKPGREVDSPLDAAARAAELGGEILAMFSPVKGENLSSSVASLVPPVASEAIELGINKDLYRGNTIATDRRDENASRLSKGVAAGLNYAGNTDQVRPSQVEHVIRGVGGYAGQLATAASDLGRDRGERRPIQDIPVVGGLAGRVIRDTGGQRLEDVSSIEARVPESVRAVLAEVGMRSDQVTDVPSRYKGAPLTREEQERWQVATTGLIEREIALARRSSEWRDRGADREQLVRDAIATAKTAAAERALRRLTDAEIERRVRREEQRKGA